MEQPNGTPLDELRKQGYLKDSLDAPGESGLNVEIVQELRDFCLFHGNQMKILTDPVKEPSFAHCSSTTIVPTPFSRSGYEFSMKIQPILNKLSYYVSRDHRFLEDSLASVIENDEFTRRHWEIYQEVRASQQNSVFLGLIRSDYMCHQSTDIIKQVELNTMSAAASGVNRAATKWHRYVCGTLLHMDEQNHIPDNGATPMLARGLCRAWSLYSQPKAAILFVVNEIEFNFADQRALQYSIHEINRDIKIIRATFNHLQQHMTLNSDNRMFCGLVEIAVVYFRSGYTPKHYPNEQTWKLRRDIELSTAVKCPDVAHFLSGTKRIQQILSNKQTLLRWLTKEESELLSNVFVELHSLNQDEGCEEHKELALNNPSDFVLKPQREGGGNNFYGSELVEKLNTETNLSAYTLMERIVPPAQENYIVAANNQPLHANVVSELGIFGSYVVQNGIEVLNESSGYLFRSKPSDRNEGDLMRGTSSLDSPWFV